MARPKIGQILLKLGFIDEMKLQSALSHQRQWGTPLARAVVELRFCTVDNVMRALSEQTGLPIVNLAAEQLDPKLATILPFKVAEQHRMVPLRVEGSRAEVLVIAIAAPASISSMDAAQAVSRKQRIKALLAPDEAIDHALRVVYLGEKIQSAPMVFDAAVDAREQEFDPSSKQTPEPNPASTFALTLTPDCLRVIHRAAAHHGISEATVIERVLEAWASRQRGA